MWDFVKLSVASAVMICLEIWYFMTIIVLTGHLEDPVVAVGSLSICMNINGWEGMLFIVINAAISVRALNELGSGHLTGAKYSVISHNGRIAPNRDNCHVPCYDNQKPFCGHLHRQQGDATSSF